MRTIFTLVVAVMALVASAIPAAADDYSDPEYLAFDADTMARSTVRGDQRAQFTDVEQHSAFAPLAVHTWLERLGEQVGNARHGRIYTGLGRLVPGGAVGNPKTYHDIQPIDVSFLSRTGAELQGHLFWDRKPGKHPSVVITTGSIQGMQQSYWWAARTLARNGYLVFTWDAQGQGDSEGFGHEPGSPLPTVGGFPSQQDANFDEGTIDALRFFLSTADDEYLPDGWSTQDRDRAQDQGTIRWSNPLWAFLDSDRIGLAGHSLGAQAVSRVQQCSDQGQVWRDVELCGGQSYPIRTVVAWDALSESVAPVVPAMDQQADGYFFNPTPSPQPPDPSAQLGAFERWRESGVDVYSFTVRGGTHLEWNEIPYILPATSYGTVQADYYTLAWFERYLRPEQTRQRQGARMLLNGPIPDAESDGRDEYAWRANFFSARHLSAFAFTDHSGRLRAARDLRAYAGLSPVGDWAGANDDQPAEREP